MICLPKPPATFQPESVMSSQQIPIFPVFYFLQSSSLSLSFCLPCLKPCWFHLFRLAYTHKHKHKHKLTLIYQTYFCYSSLNWLIQFYSFIFLFCFVFSHWFSTQRIRMIKAFFCSLLTNRTLFNTITTTTTISQPYIDHCYPTICLAIFIFCYCYFTRKMFIHAKNIGFFLVRVCTTKYSPQQNTALQQDLEQATTSEIKWKKEKREQFQFKQHTFLNEL